ncbi:MAG: MraY family glycosyltransferase [Phycisphaerae bacterium]
MMIVWVSLAAVATAAVLSALATAFAGNVAFRLGMVDVPGRHKLHARPTPLLGGSAILAAILLPSVLVLALASIWARTGVPGWLPLGQSVTVHIPGAAEKAPQALGILLGALALHVMGLIDDRRALGPWIKLVTELVVCSAVVMLLNVRVLTVIGEPYSSILSVLWLVAVTNAFNFLDNMDGLSAGVALICGTALLAAAVNLHQVFVSAWLCLLVGALMGFLPFNFPPAKIFMGDAGSLVVGYMLAVVSCLTTYVAPGDEFYAYGVFVPVVAMAVPLYDMASVVLLRVRRRLNPMVGDRRHFSHRLLRRGMRVRTAVLTVYLCTGATAVGATLLSHVTSMAAAVLIFVQTLLILLIIALLEAGGSRT